MKMYTILTFIKITKGTAKFEGFLAVRMDLAKKIVEGFLAVRMDLAKIFLKAF